MTTEQNTPVDPHDGQIMRTPLNNEALLESIIVMHKTLLDAINDMRDALLKNIANDRNHADEIKSIILASEQMMSAAMVRDGNLLRQHRSCIEGNDRH